MVELAALEKRYGVTHRGFESLSLRHRKKTSALVFFLWYTVMREVQTLIQKDEGYTLLTTS